MNHSGSDALKAVTVSAVTATLINTFDASPYEWSATWFGYFNVSALNPLVYFGMTDGSCVPFLISDISQRCLSTRTVVGKTITGWMKGHALFCHLYLFYHYDGTNTVLRTTFSKGCRLVQQCGISLMHFRDQNAAVCFVLKYNVHLTASVVLMNAASVMSFLQRWNAFTEGHDAIFLLICSSFAGMWPSVDAHERPMKCVNIIGSVLMLHVFIAVCLLFSHLSVWRSRRLCLSCVGPSVASAPPQ